MKTSRIQIDETAVFVKPLDLKNANCKSLLGDNRELMRHSDGALHAAIIETIDGYPRMNLFGLNNFHEDWQRLAGPISSPKSNGDSQPATDSNQNGIYVAYIESGTGHKQAGHVVHIPDMFGAPSHFKVHGPLTPEDGLWKNSFLQCSRGFNSVVYGWRDERTGSIYVGVSKDGNSFPPAKLVIEDKNIVNGPAVGIRGDYVLLVYQTSNPEFAPHSASHNGHDQHYYVWSESGDGGETWSQPSPLLPDPKDLPVAIAYSVSNENDLQRREVELSGIGSLFASLQVLAWAVPTSIEAVAGPSRLFALTSVAPGGHDGEQQWGTNSVGVLMWKPIAVGGTWTPVLTNRSLFRGAKLEQPYAGRTGTQYKYCALPGTVVRVIAYVDKAPDKSRLEDQVVILVSTNLGNSFDYEQSFNASQLHLEPDAEIVISNSACCFADPEGNVWQDLLFGDAKRPQRIQHAMLPIGINVQDIDTTLTW